MDLWLRLCGIFRRSAEFPPPCVLPLVPGYLCFCRRLQFSELSALEEKGQAQRILPGALAFVGGFSAVFIALGAGATRRPLLAYQTELAYIAGGAIIILGCMSPNLYFPHFGARYALKTIAVRNRAAVAAFIMGLAFAFGWTPCIGPILATILALATARDSLGEGVSLLPFMRPVLACHLFLPPSASGSFSPPAKSRSPYGLW